jgi:hypothetical protein
MWQIDLHSLTDSRLLREFSAILRGVPEGVGSRNPRSAPRPGRRPQLCELSCRRHVWASALGGINTQLKLDPRTGKDGAGAAGFPVR